MTALLQVLPADGRSWVVMKEGELLVPYKIRAWRFEETSSPRSDMKLDPICYDVEEDLAFFPAVVDGYECLVDDALDAEDAARQAAKQIENRDDDEDDGT